MFTVLKNGEIDAGIAVSDQLRKGLLEIPLYTERFYCSWHYVAKSYNFVE